MKLTRILALFLLASALPATAAAQGQPAPAPELLFVLGADVYTTGSSSNFGQATKAYIDEYYAAGACEAANDWATCDDIQFGMEVHAGRACDDCIVKGGVSVNLLDPVSGTCSSPTLDGAISYMHAPGEDVGADVKAELQNIHNSGGGSKYCNSGTFINHDTAMMAVWEKTFPDTVDATEAQLDAYWGTNVVPAQSRPHLNFLLVEAFPRSKNGSDDGRLYRSLAQTCAMSSGGFQHTGVACFDDSLCGAGETCECPNLEPNCTIGKQCAAPSGLPSNPTWVLTERKSSEPEAVYAGMIAAAGRTGQCEEKVMGNWAVIDVCEYLTRTTVTSDSIKTNILNGNLRCGPAAGHATPGALDYGGSTGTLGEIQCHMFGEIANNTCSNAFETDLFGIFQCIRQLPRAVAPADTVIRFCPDGLPEVDDDNPFDDGCTVLRESKGEIEFIDPNRTLFVIVSGPGKAGDACTGHSDCGGLCINNLCDNTNKCDGGGVEVFECPYGPCETGLPGRCAAGQVDCPDGQLLCVPESGAFPEICNGLDDDCNGSVDDMKESWADGAIGDAYTLPDDHAGLHCNEVNVCSCPDGITDTHNGTDWDSFLDGWSGACECGEGLSPDTYTPAPGSDADPDMDQATCAAVGSDQGVPAMFLALLALGFAPLLRRRRN